MCCTLFSTHILCVCVLCRWMHFANAYHSAHVQMAATHRPHPSFASLALGSLTTGLAIRRHFWVLCQHACVVHCAFDPIPCGRCVRGGLKCNAIDCKTCKRQSYYYANQTILHKVASSIGACRIICTLRTLAKNRLTIRTSILGWI